MPYTTELFERSAQIIEERRLTAEREAEARRALFEKTEPEYRQWKEQMITSVREVLKSIQMSPADAAALITEQKGRNLTAQQKIKDLLARYGLSPDYLNPVYTCKLCEDTGVKDGKMCVCRIELLKTLAFEEAGKRSPLRFSNFEEFRLDYYDSEFNPTYGCSSRERMEAIYHFCRQYASEFEPDSAGILMLGSTGLGKTHLSLAIAGEVIKKGYHVIYNSAQNIFNTLEKEHFGRSDTAGAFEAMVLECDLLLIDDLGAEFATSFSNAALYNILNTRLNSNLPTIISTNFTLKEIEEKYTQRISSRFIGEYYNLIFFGNDVRQTRKNRG